MHFQDLADTFLAPTCIISVERKQDGGYGEIRLVAGNRAYLEPIEHPMATGVMEMPNQTETKFIPNSLYERYLPKDIGFEDICFRAAVQKTPVHTYVHLNYLDLWFDLFVMPIGREDGDVCYCAYTAQPCSAADIGLSSSGSGGTSEDVLKTCIKLHEAHDFTETMREVIQDIRILCRAEVCTILLLDRSEHSYSIPATSIDAHSTVRRVTTFPHFYEIAVSWGEMLGDSDCLIIKSPRDLEYVSRINPAWYQTLAEAGVDSVVLFPLRYEGEILGFIWATNFDTRNTMRIKETLELTTFFISSEIARNRMVERLRSISYSDVLTGLHSRFACTDLIEELVRHGERFTAVSIDLSRFKSINDTMGYETGNRVLTHIARRWKRLAEEGQTGTEDFVARLGGDEFALVIRGYETQDQVLASIRQYEAALGRRLTIDGCDFYLTAGFGFAEFPADAQTADAVMSHADAAMHEAKSRGGSDPILRFSPDMLRLERTQEIEGKIRAALENDTICFYLQPQYDMEHRLRGFEALARMQDDDGNFISPGEFIPVAEKVGLIDKVDGTVFRKSAMFFGELLRKTGADLILSINASVRHLMKNDFLEEIRTLLETSGLPAAQLEIEITESIMIDSAEKALECIGALREMGVKLAIDDFGTGYSSLSYLNTFPANLLKIDKSFIDRMNASESSQQYVAAIISIGHIMGFEVISEGVEEPDQLETLRSNGCDFIQGFIWGRPMPPEAAEQLVMTQ